MKRSIFLLAPILVFFSGVHLAFAEPTTVGLVSHWRLDETTSGGSGSVIDSSGNNHGTPSGATGTNNNPQPSTDVPEVSFANPRSLDFDGTDDVVITPYSPAFTTGDAFTWSLWFKTDTNQSGRGIFSARDTGKAGNPLAEIYLASGQIQGLFRGADGVRRDLLYTVNYADDEWHNVSIVIDDGEGIMYFDGVERSTFSGLNMNIDLSDVYLPIGASNYENTVQRFFQGKVDDVRVYNRALTAGEVSELAGKFPITENFNGTQPEKWVLKQSAAWGATVGGESTLRLTTAAASQSGLGYYDTAFSSEKGIVVEFDYYANEATGINGADGIAFFLVDGDLVNIDNIEAGAFGGSLGYAQSGLTPGVPHAYLGVGFDEFGNFAAGSGSAVSDNVTLRGKGNGTVGYGYLTHTQVSASPINQTIDGGWRTARITISPVDAGAVVRVEMSWDDGDTWVTVIDDYEYNEAPPDHLKLGFAASTGGSNNIHAIDNLEVIIPVDLVTALTVPPSGDYVANDSITYTYTVANVGNNDSADTTITNTVITGASGISNLTWELSSTHGPSASGDADDIGTINIAIPAGETVTIQVSGNIGADVEMGDNLNHTITAVPEDGTRDPSTGDAIVEVVIDTEDDADPLVESFVPTHTSVDVGIDSALTITFNERVEWSFEENSVVVYRASDDSVFYAQSGGGGNGTVALTVSFPTEFEPNTEYYVLISADAITDVSGNPFAGISTSSTWRFTTGAEEVAENQERKQSSSSSASSQISNLLKIGNFERAQELMRRFPNAFSGQASSPAASIQSPVQENSQSCQLGMINRVLRTGAEGEDVRSLQKFLNCAGFLLALEGPGSQSNETIYFSDRTYGALIRFQEHYASDILTPLNLTRGTGIFGERSKMKAEALSTAN
jgi:hypothetical protein